MSTDHPSHDGETSATRVVIAGRAYQYHPSQPLTIRSVFVTIRFIFAWLFACLLYFLMIIGLHGMGCCDPNGGIWHLAHSSRQDFQDLFAGFLLLNTFVLWVVLGFQLLMGAFNVETPRRAAILTFVLHPLTFAAAFAAIDLRERYDGWAIVVPVLLPPLIGLYAIWARFPQLHKKPPGKFTSVIWAAILVLTIAPIPLFFVDARAYPERQKERIAAAQAFNDRQRQLLDASLARLTPESSLRDYLDYERLFYQKQQWLEGVRRVKSRQTDAVMLLRDGHIDRLRDLWQFEIEATPSLCEAFDHALRRMAAQIGPPRPNAPGVANLFAYQLPNIKWLISAHCNLEDALTDLDTRLRAFPGGPMLDDFLAALAQAREPH